MPLDTNLRVIAVQMIKDGHLPSAVYAHLLHGGATPDDANACIGELLALKAAAEARNPARLRADAARMLFYGASIEDVVRYFEGLGVLREHALPEIERTATAVRGMIACQRCGQPSARAEVFFDPSGIQICKICQSQNLAHEAQRRVVESQENERNAHLAMGAFGMLTLSPRAAVRGFLDASSSAPPPGPTTCPRCRLSTGVHVQMLSPQVRARMPAGVTYACGRCATVIA